MRNLTFSCLLLSCSLAALAQPVDSLWSRFYGGTGNDGCFAVRQTTDGGYILAGNTNYSATDVDAWLVKTNPQGDITWTRMYGGVLTEVAHDVVQLTGGGYAWCGTTESYGNGYFDAYFILTDADGVPQSAGNWGGTGYDDLRSLQQTSDGGFVLGGEINSVSTGTDFLLVKTDSLGGNSWTRTFGGNSAEACYTIRQTSDGGYALAGYTFSFGAGQSDMWLVRTNSAGQTLWNRTFGSGGYEVCRAMELCSDGGFILAGYATPALGTPPDFYAVKTDANGTMLWSRTYGGTYNDECNSVIQTADGGYLMAGTTSSSGAGNVDMWLLKMSASGDHQWSRTFGGSGNDVCYAVQRTTDGGYIVGGITSSFGAAGNDIWLVKTGPEPLSSASQGEIVPLGFSLEPNYPNPFNGATMIRFAVPHAARVTIRSHDVLGRQVSLIADEVYATGSHALAWDCPDCASGMYVITLAADGFRATQRAMLVR